MSSASITASAYACEAKVEERRHAEVTYAFETLDGLQRGQTDFFVGFAGQDELVVFHFVFELRFAFLNDSLGGRASPQSRSPVPSLHRESTVLPFSPTAESIDHAQQ